MVRASVERSEAFSSRSVAFCSIAIRADKSSRLSPAISLVSFAELACASSLWFDCERTTRTTRTTRTRSEVGRIGALRSLSLVGRHV